MGFLRYLPDKNNKANLEFDLTKNGTVKRDDLLDLLDKYGYVRESIVTTTGEYAVRGFVIDLFVIDEEHPIRVEFFGDDIESIRYFDESTQLSLKELDSIKIKPYSEIISDTNSSLCDYMDDPYLIMVNRDQIEVGYEKLLEDITEYKEKEELDSDKKFMFDWEEITYNYVTYLNTISDNSYGKVLSFNSQEINNFGSDLNY